MKPYQVVVWGDSIAREGSSPWPDHCQSHLNVSCFTGREVKIVNIARCGLSGVMGQHLFDKEVKPADPDLVVIQFGFNDLRHDSSVGAHPIGTPDRFEEAMRSMIRNSKSIGADVLVLGIHDYTFGALRLYPGGLNGDQTTEIYRLRAKSAAAQEGADYISMKDAAAAQGLSPRDITCDGCHLSETGKLIYTLTVSNYILNKLKEI